MSERAKRGRELFEAGYSCAEATWLALNEDLSEELLNFGLQLSGGFSGGFASGKVCGAISGVTLSLGRLYGRKMGEEKPELLRLKVQKLLAHVEELYKSTHCYEIRPAENYRPFCAELVEQVLEYAESLLEE